MQSIFVKRYGIEHPAWWAPPPCFQIPCHFYFPPTIDRWISCRVLNTVKNNKVQQTAPPTLAIILWVEPIFMLIKKMQEAEYFLVSLIYQLYHSGHCVRDSAEACHSCLRLSKWSTIYLWQIQFIQHVFLQTKHDQCKTFLARLQCGS